MLDSTTSGCSLHKGVVRVQSGYCSNGSLLQEETNSVSSSVLPVPNGAKYVDKKKSASF